MIVAPLPRGGLASPKKPVQGAASPTKSKFQVNVSNPTKIEEPPSLSPKTATRMARVFRTVRAAKLRASLLQTMVALLDHEDERGLESILQVLHALAELPLSDPRERARCLACLKALGRRRHRRQSMDETETDDRSSGFSSDGDDEGDGEDIDVDLDVDGLGTFRPLGSTMPPSFVHKYLTQEEPMRDSGRPKSVSLRHCRAFLLACANEIHELDAEDPAFDYAEDTSSDGSMHVLQPVTNSILQDRFDANRFDFDYASTAMDASSVATGDLSFRMPERALEFSVDDDDDDDDLAADQGSQLSDVLHRAEFLTDEEPSPTRNARSTFRDRYPNSSSKSSDTTGKNHELCLRVFTAWRRESSAKNNPKVLAVKLHAFRALQRARGLSRSNLARKRRAFQKLKTFDRYTTPTKAPYQLFPTTALKSKDVKVGNPISTWVRTATAAAHATIPKRADIALVLVLAFLTHAST